MDQNIKCRTSNNKTPEEEEKPDESAVLYLHRKHLGRGVSRRSRSGPRLRSHLWPATSDPRDRVSSRSETSSFFFTPKALMRLQRSRHGRPASRGLMEHFNYLALQGKGIDNVWSTDASIGFGCWMSFL